MGRDQATNKTKSRTTSRWMVMNSCLMPADYLHHCYGQRSHQQHQKQNHKQVNGNEFMFDASWLFASFLCAGTRKGSQRCKVNEFMFNTSWLFYYTTPTCSTCTGLFLVLFVIINVLIILVLCNVALFASYNRSTITFSNFHYSAICMEVWTTKLTCE